MKFLEKVLSLGLYLLAFLLPLQTRLFIRPGELNGGYFEYGTISLYGTDMLLVLLMLVLIVYKIKQNKFSIFNFSRQGGTPPRRWQFSNNFQFSISKYLQDVGGADRRLPRPAEAGLAMTKRLTCLIVCLNIAALISVFAAGDKLLSFYNYVRLTLGMGLFFLVSNAAYDYIKIIYAFLAGAVVQASLGIWQFLAQATFASKWLGLAAHPAEVGGTSVIETLAGGRWLRAYGGLDHPNVFGGFLSVSLLLIVYLMLRNEIDDKIFNFQFSIFNKFQISKFLIKQTFFYFLFFIFLSALFFTFSRGAWAGFIVGSIFILAFKLWQWDKSSLRQLFALAAASAVLVGVLFINYQSLATTRLSNNARLEIKSNLERTASYKDGIAIIKDHWLAGVGIGGYTRSLVKLHPNEPSWFYQPTHNVFLLVWAEVGIVGLILFIAVVAYILIFNFQFFPPRRDPAKAVAIFNKFSIFNLSILLTLVIIMLPDHYFWSLHFGVLFFWLIIGLNIKIIESDN